MDLGPQIVRNSYQCLLVQSGNNPIRLGNNGSVNWSAGGVVDSTGNQTIGGTKTFSSTINGNISGNASTVTSGVYLIGDQTIGGAKTFSSIINGNISGNAATVTNGIYSTGNQTISGVKTFASTVNANITGSAGSVLNGVYATGDQIISGIKTFSSVINANITGNASTVTSGVYLIGDQTINGFKTFTTGISAPNIVYNTGNQIISGTKTFSSAISGSILGNAGTVTNGVYTIGNQIIGGAKTFANGLTVSGNSIIGNYNLSGSNSFGFSALSNNFGNSASANNFGNFSSGNVFGSGAISNIIGSQFSANALDGNWQLNGSLNAASAILAQNLVYNTGNQTISGVKTFASTVNIQSLTGNAFGTGIAQFLATPTSDNLRAAITNDTGTDALVFANGPTINSPTIASPIITGSPSFLHVLTPTSELSIRDIFATGGTTSGTIGDLRWSLLGTGASVTYLGQSVGSFALLNVNAITNALNCTTIALNNQGYTGSGFFTFSTTRSFQMVASVGSGNFANRNRSFSFCFASQPSGNQMTAPQSATPPNSIGIRYIMPSQGAWEAARAYVVGYNARPVTDNGLKYICTTPGTSGATQPTWPTTIGGTVVDGTATWTCAGADGNASHLLQFFVAGADPLVNITTANSTIAMPSSNNQFLTLSIRTTSTGVFFSVNNETEVFIATTTAISGTPAFIARNDNNATFSNSVVPIRYFGFYAASKF